MSGSLTIYTGTQQRKNTMPSSSATARQNGFSSTPLFAIAFDHKVIGDSPAADFKQVKVDNPIRPTPTWEQFLAIVEDIRKQKFNADATDSADLVEFMGRAGVGTAECANMLGENVDLAGDRITLYRKKTESFRPPPSNSKNSMMWAADCIGVREDDHRGRFHACNVVRPIILLPQPVSELCE